MILNTTLWACVVDFASARKARRFREQMQDEDMGRKVGEVKSRLSYQMI